MRSRLSVSVLGLSLLAAACGGSTGSTEPAAPVAAAAPVDPLVSLTQGLAAGSVRVVDLTQLLSPETPVIQLPPPFANTPGVVVHEISKYDAKGPAWYWNWLEIGEHVGTHFDAPCHWVTGKGKACVDVLDAKQFVGPAVVIDVRTDVAASADYVLTSEAILAWEKAHGRIPDGAWVILNTGWGRRATDGKAFFNAGPDGAPHYPGFGKAAAEFLTRERSILGVGTEAVGTDAAVGAKADPPFPNHSTMHGAGKFGLTQLANVDQLPATGAVVIATPLKIKDGSGSPVRAIALIPAR